MLFLLRNIRRKMLTNNKVATYLLYAIGEIALVVIGILIAVQIDDWNQQRKESHLELNLLRSLRNDLIKNEEKIRAVLTYDSLCIAKNTKLLVILNGKSLTYHDSLKHYFSYLSSYKIFFPQRMAYENIRSKGLEIIKNDTLRERLVELYDETYFHSLHIGERKAQIEHDTSPIFNRLLYSDLESGYKIPNDFEALKTDREFLNTLSDITRDRRGTMYQTNHMLKNTIQLTELINKEISL